LIIGQNFCFHLYDGCMKALVLFDLQPSLLGFLRDMGSLLMFCDTNKTSTTILITILSMKSLTESKKAKG